MADRDYELKFRSCGATSWTAGGYTIELNPPDYTAICGHKIIGTYATFSEAEAEANKHNWQQSGGRWRLQT